MLWLHFKGLVFLCHTGKKPNQHPSLHLIFFFWYKICSRDICCFWLVGRGDLQSQRCRGLGWIVCRLRVGPTLSSKVESTGINSSHLRLSLFLNFYKFLMFHKQLDKCLQVEGTHLKPWTAFLFCPWKNRWAGRGKGFRNPQAPPQARRRQHSTQQCPGSQASQRKRRGWTAP